MAMAALASSSMLLKSPAPASSRLFPPFSCSHSSACCATSRIPFSGLIHGAAPDSAQGRKVRVQAVAGGRDGGSAGLQEEVFFDGGPHYGDLVVNIVFGFSLVWLPLTLAAVFRNLFLRYRFTNLRVTIISGLTGEDRKDFGYNVVKDVQVVPRFIGEWGDVVITLKDGAKVDLRCVPKFREVAKFCLDKAGEKSVSDAAPESAKGFAS